MLIYSLFRFVAPIIFAATSFGALAEEPKTIQDFIALQQLSDVTGTVHTFKCSEASPVVLAWTAADCPMAKDYAPRLRSLVAEFAPRGIRFFLIDSSSDAAPEKLRAAMKDYAFMPVIRDERGDVARLAGARSTTDVVVLDSDKRVIYRGAIDDQYGKRADTVHKEAPTQHYLRDALFALVVGKLPALATTDSVGTPLEWTLGKPDVALAGGAEFHGDVERIFRKHCQDCHQDGGSAPFSLVTYDDVRRHGRMVRKVVMDRRMPPWNASPEHGVFANDPTLSAEEIAKVQRWIDGGIPAGALANALPPLPKRDDWQIGKPDMIFETEPIEIAADGQVPYRYVRVPTNLKEDRWVEAAQIVSTPPAIVHHVLVFVENSAPAAPGVTRPWTPHFDKLSLLEGAKPEDRWKWIIRMSPYIAKDLQVGSGGGLNGSFVTTQSAGRGMIYPPGRAKLLPAGSTLVLQIHYTPDGMKHETKTRLGLRFAKTPPVEPVDSRSLATVAFEIPAGEKSCEVTASRVMPRDALLLSLRPHMHLRGKSFYYTAEFPDGKKETLLDVPKWDFEWQVEYVLAKPLLLPKGTRLRAHAIYDNSAENPTNPDPTKNVFFGLQSNEEMMIGYYEVVWNPDMKSSFAKASK